MRLILVEVPVVVDSGAGCAVGGLVGGLGGLVAGWALTGSETKEAIKPTTIHLIINLHVIS